MNPETFLNRKPSRPGEKTKRREASTSQKQEKRVAFRLKGKVQPKSGAGRVPARAVGVTSYRAGGKGDVPTDLLLCECKTTEHASISVKQEHLIKITREAKLQMKSPAMVISFPVMPDDVDEDWIILPVSVWEKLHGQPGGSPASGVPAGLAGEGDRPKDDPPK